MNYKNIDNLRKNIILSSSSFISNRSSCFQSPHTTESDDAKVREMYQLRKTKSK